MELTAGGDRYICPALPECQLLSGTAWLCFVSILDMSGQPGKVSLHRDHGVLGILWDLSQVCWSVRGGASEKPEEDRVCGPKEPSAHLHSGAVAPENPLETFTVGLRKAVSSFFLVNGIFSEKFFWLSSFRGTEEHAGVDGGCSVEVFSEATMARHLELRPVLLWKCQGGLAGWGFVIV